MRTNKIKKSMSTRVFDIIGYVFVGLLAIVCLAPFIMILSGSISDESLVNRLGYSILPRGFSLDAYVTLFKYPASIIKAYLNTILITVTGTAISLLLITMTAYVISRTDFKYRNAFSFFFFFTTLFSGGIVSTYIYMVKYYHLKDSYVALILPYVFSVFFLLIMKSFMRAIPMEIIESAKIDGAGEWKIFLTMIIPLAKSGMATICLFVALEYWNDWYNTMLYISDSNKFTLQYLLYNMLASAEGFSKMSSVTAASVQLPTQTLKLAMTVVAAGPIIILYPFVQKYFVQGITIGAVKG